MVYLFILCLGFTLSFYLVTAYRQLNIPIMHSDVQALSAFISNVSAIIVLYGLIVLYKDTVKTQNKLHIFEVDV